VPMLCQHHVLHSRFVLIDCHEKEDARVVFCVPLRPPTDPHRYFLTFYYVVHARAITDLLILSTGISAKFCRVNLNINSKGKQLNFYGGVDSSKASG